LKDVHNCPLSSQLHESIICTPQFCVVIIVMLQIDICIDARAPHA
jgi:hypothetical protein